LRRKQFPLRPAFAITINKAQGQTLKKVGVFLPESVFSHGQLYTAFSRVGAATCLSVFIPVPQKSKHVSNQRRQPASSFWTHNVVYEELLSEVFGVPTAAPAPNVPTANSRRPLLDNSHSDAGYPEREYCSDCLLIDNENKRPEECSLCVFHEQ